MIFSTLFHRMAREQIWSDSRGWLTVVKEERVGAFRVLRCVGRFGETIWVSRR